MSRFSKLFFCTFLSGLLLSCEGDYYIDYEWVSMDAIHGNNSNKWPEPSSDDSISADHYVLILQMETNELKREGRYLDQESPPSNVNGLDSLFIYSSKDFDSEHPANSNLTDLFVILNDTYYSTLPADGSEGYWINNHQSPRFYDDPNVTHIDLMLQQKPSLKDSFRFYVRMVLDDGTAFTDSTTSIALF
ncbi:MAG: hypothetical protein COA58_13675 [Bacteroidetes bacterium]|nr:MAG: hypothetical protein COA58_13675 [Bacteroidota bacterium]